MVSGMGTCSVLRHYDRYAQMDCGMVCRLRNVLRVCLDRWQNEHDG